MITEQLPVVELHGSPRERGRQHGAALRAPIALHIARTKEWLAGENGGDADGFIAEFLEHGGLQEWKHLGFGAWDENALSWHDKAMPFPRLTLRYEDLKANPVEGVTRLCRFLKLNKSGREIGDAIEAASFSAVRALEEQEVAGGKPGIFALENRRNTGGKRFMNKGEVDAYRDALTHEEARRLRQRFARAMAHFRYAG